MKWVGMGRWWPCWRCHQQKTSSIATSRCWNVLRTFSASKLGHLRSLDRFFPEAVWIFRASPATAERHRRPAKSTGAISPIANCRGEESAHIDSCQSTNPRRMFKVFFAAQPDPKTTGWRGGRCRFLPVHNGRSDAWHMTGCSLTPWKSVMKSPRTRHGMGVNAFNGRDQSAPNHIMLTMGCELNEILHLSIFHLGNQ
jgi:hypothetical protein